MQWVLSIINKGLLILTRQRDEIIVLDFSEATDDELLSLRLRPAFVLPADIRGDRVRLGFNAAKYVKILRLELWLEDQRARGERERLLKGIVRPGLAAAPPSAATAASG